jgi:hypothetical protein
MMGATIVIYILSTQFALFGDVKSQTLNYEAKDSYEYNSTTHMNLISLERIGLKELIDIANQNASQADKLPYNYTLLTSGQK